MTASILSARTCPWHAIPAATCRRDRQTLLAEDSTLMNGTQASHTQRCTPSSVTWLPVRFADHRAKSTRCLPPTWRRCAPRCWGCSKRTGRGSSSGSLTWPRPAVACRQQQYHQQQQEQGLLQRQRRRPALLAGCNLCVAVVCGSRVGGVLQCAALLQQLFLHPASTHCLPTWLPDAPHGCCPCAAPQLRPEL